MDSTAQIIVATGVAFLLLMMGSSGVIWSLRCDPKRPHYRLPAFLALAAPASITIIWSLARIS